jgi:hypothetical protein
MDLVIINIFSIVIAGVGIFGALSRFAPIEQHRTYYGQNLLLMKSDIQLKMRAYIYAGIANFGLLIQVIKIIWLSDLPDRLFYGSYYFSILFTLLCFSVFLIVTINYISDLIAKKYWLPDAEDVIMTAVERGKEILHNHGVFDKKVDPTLSDAQQKAKNYRQTIDSLMLTCRLMDIHYTVIEAKSDDLELLHKEVATIVSSIEQRL